MPARWAAKVPSVAVLSKVKAGALNTLLPL